MLPTVATTVRWSAVERMTDRHRWYAKVAACLKMECDRLCLRLDDLRNHRYYNVTCHVFRTPALRVLCQLR